MYVQDGFVENVNLEIYVIFRMLHRTVSKLNDLNPRIALKVEAEHRVDGTLSKAVVIHQAEGGQLLMEDMTTKIVVG